MRLTIHVVTALAAGVIPACGLIGCQSRNAADVSAPTQTDRILQAYPEIQGGRLLILADFEDDRQMALFRLESGSSPGRLVRDEKRGRRETGLGTLAVTFADPSETLVVASPTEGDAFLKRDWRPYDLFLVAVQSPAGGLVLETEIAGGAAGQAVETQTGTTLTEGWNFLRFDLAEIGEEVPLDDVREIRLRVAESHGEPVTLHVDDLLLVGNRHNLFGDSANTAGELYVQNAGRNWNVGVPGRFEIAFRNGQITRWFNLAADSYRLRNLVRGTSLGPMPVLVDGGRIVGPAISSREAVLAQQRIVEMNEVRVVIDCVWETKGNDRKLPFNRRTYTIYATGQVFVNATTSPADSQIAMAVNLAWSPDAPTIRIHSGSTISETKLGSTPTFALARGLGADAALLFIPYPDAERVDLTEVNDPGLKTTSILWQSTGGQSEENWRSQIVLASSSALDDSGAFSRAVDYTEPNGLRIEVGTPFSNSALRSDGFDPGSGSFFLAPEAGRLRAVLMGKQRPVFGPAFTVDGKSTGEAWVYVNHLVYSDLIRGSRGELVFQLPDVALKEIVVEALFRK